MKPKLSICMMVKNEETNLPRCLDSLHQLRSAVSNELIIVDTGSADNTVNIAQQYTDKVYFHEWNNNFSEMRNITIGYAKGEWLLIIDADEEIIKADGLVQFLTKKQKEMIKGAALSVKSFTSDTNFVMLTSARVFRNDGKFHYEGAIHNTPTIFGAILSIDDAVINHYGYIASDQELMERKFKRTGELLKRELEKDPDNIYYRYQLSVSFSMHNDWEESHEEICKAYDSMQRNQLTPGKYIYVFGQYAKTCLRNELYKQAEKICLEGLEVEGEYVDLYFYLGQAQALQKKDTDAIASYERYLELVDSFDTLKIKHNPNVNHYSLGGKPEVIFNLAVLYNRQGNYHKAFNCARLFTYDQSLFAEQSLLLLAELSFRVGKFDLLKEVYFFLEKNDLKNKLVENIERCKNTQNFDEFRRLVLSFANTEDNFGKLNNIRLKYINDSDDLPKVLQEIISTNIWDFNMLPEYYFDIIYYALKYDDLGSTAVARLSEVNIIRMLKYLDKFYHNAVVEIIKKRDFIDNTNSFATLKLNKVLLKYILFSGELSNEKDYLKYFKLYLSNGINYIKALYNPDIICEELIYDVKNVEEAFLLLMGLAEQERADKRRLVEYIKKAVNIYADMSKGVGMILREMDNELTTGGQDDAMKSLKAQLIAQIDMLINTGDSDAALQVIAEYEKIMGKDLDILGKKAEALMCQQ